MPASKPAMPSSPARKAKSVGERPSQLPIAAGSPAVEGHDESPEKLSLKARLKLFEKEIEQQGSVAPAPKPGLFLIFYVLDKLAMYCFSIFVEKKFSFLNPDEIAKMKEEEERRIAQMTRFEFEKMTTAASREAESWTDATLEDVEAIDKMARGQPAPKRSLDSGPHSIPYTAKGERLLRERLEREGEPLPEDLENLDNLSPEEKKAVDAERRAAWRKARLKSLENVRNFYKPVEPKFKKTLKSNKPIKPEFEVKSQTRTQRFLNPTH